MTAPYRCQAVATSGAQCKRAAVLNTDGSVPWSTCSGSAHERKPDHIGAAADHLRAAMQHDAWARVPRQIQHLIEWASVDIGRARGEVRP